MTAPSGGQRSNASTADGGRPIEKDVFLRLSRCKTPCLCDVQIDGYHGHQSLRITVTTLPRMEAWVPSMGE